MTESLAAADCERYALDASDGHRVVVDHWQPQNAAPRAVLQILHGLSEHAGRYERFARQCAAQGFAVVAHNHRGHGEACERDELGHFADADGWQKVVADAGLVQDAARERHPDLPVMLFGHSMGSYIAQALVMERPDAVAALVLSGSTHPPRWRLHAGRFAAWLENLRHGGRYRSPELQKQSFGSFNRRFVPVRTEFDWLSRDGVEVDRYVHDVLCGATPSVQLWRDLIGGLLMIGKASSLRKVPAALPVLVTGGSEDPVGGRRGMQVLVDRYRAAGHDNVRLQLYEGGRHEMLNETNRDEFTADVIGWLQEFAGGASRDDVS